MLFVRNLQRAALVALSCACLWATNAVAQTVSAYGAAPRLTGVALGATSGEVFVVSTANGNVFRISAGGTTTTLYGDGPSGGGDIVRSATGALFVANENGGGQLLRYEPGCTVPCTPTVLDTGDIPVFLALDTSNNLFVSSFANGTILRYAADCTAPCTPVTFAQGIAGPVGMVVTASGDLFLLRDAGTILRFQTNCTIPCTGTQYATGLGSGSRGLAAGPNGSLFAANAFDQRILQVPAGGGTGTFSVYSTSPSYVFPYDVERDPATGVVYVADEAVSPNGLFAIAAPVIEDIPTLSEWAMILLVLVLAGASLLSIRRQRSAM